MKTLPNERHATRETPANDRFVLVRADGGKVHYARYDAKTRTYRVGLNGTVTLPAGWCELSDVLVGDELEYLRQQDAWLNGVNEQEPQDA